MNEKRIRDILRSTDRINRLKQELSDAATQKKSDPERWQHAAKKFHESYDTLAFPGGLAQGLEGLKNNNSESVRRALEYLEADPYYVRSGYIKEKVLHLLKKVSLTESQVARLQELCRGAKKNENRREYKAYCALEKHLQTHAKQMVKK